MSSHSGWEAKGPYTEVTFPESGPGISSLCPQDVTMWGTEWLPKVLVGCGVQVGDRESDPGLFHFKA